MAPFDIIQEVAETAVSLPKFSHKFSDGQIVVLIVGCWLVFTTQASMVIYFWSAWIKGAYMNSGTGSKDKDKNLELHEVRELKKDVFQYLDKTVFYAMTFTMPLLEEGHFYPLAVVGMLGIGAFGKTVLELFDKVKRIVKGGKDLSLTHNENDAEGIGQA